MEENYNKSEAKKAVKSCRFSDPAIVISSERALFLAAAVSRWFVRVVFGGVIACACEQQPDRSIDSWDGRTESKNLPSKTGASGGGGGPFVVGGRMPAATNPERHGESFAKLKKQIVFV